MYIEQEDILNHISAKPFHIISEAADELGVEAYVIGGYVRDIFLYRPSKDIDVVAVGSGIELAKVVAGKLGKKTHLSEHGKSRIIAIAGSRLWKTGLWRMIKTGAILRSMHWLYV